MAKASGQNSSAKSNLVNFRLPPALLSQLDEIAAREEVSRGDLARKLVIEGISRTWLDPLERRLEETDRRIAKLREDIATVLNVMLVEFAKEDPEKVERWVREHLLK